METVWNIDTFSQCYETVLLVYWQMLEDTTTVLINPLLIKKILTTLKNATLHACFLFTVTGKAFKGKSVIGKVFYK